MAGTWPHLTDDTGNTQLLLTPTVGYLFWEGFLLTGHAVLWDTDPERIHAWGPRAGLWIDGFELTAGWLNTWSSSGGPHVREGQGYDFHLGYTWKILGPLRAGLQTSYFVLNVKEIDGKKQLPIPAIRALSPQLSISLAF